MAKTVWWLFLQTNTHTATFPGIDRSPSPGSVQYSGQDDTRKCPKQKQLVIQTRLVNTSESVLLLRETFSTLYSRRDWVLWCLTIKVTSAAFKWLYNSNHNPEHHPTFHPSIDSNARSSVRPLASTIATHCAVGVWRGTALMRDTSHSSALAHTILHTHS